MNVYEIDFVDPYSPLEMFSHSEMGIVLFHHSRAQQMAPFPEKFTEDIDGGDLLLEQDIMFGTYEYDPFWECEAEQCNCSDHGEFYRFQEWDGHATDEAASKYFREKYGPGFFVHYGLYYDVEFDITDSFNYSEAYIWVDDEAKLPLLREALKQYELWAKGYELIIVDDDNEYELCTVFIEPWEMKKAVETIYGEGAVELRSPSEGWN